jgi:hypothetical protein
VYTLTPFEYTTELMVSDHTQITVPGSIDLCCREAPLRDIGLARLPGFQQGTSTWLVATSLQQKACSCRFHGHTVKCHGMDAHAVMVQVVHRASPCHSLALLAKHLCGQAQLASRTPGHTLKQSCTLLPPPPFRSTEEHPDWRDAAAVASLDRSTWPGSAAGGGGGSPQ